jgi:hypothetical protein
VVDVGLRNALSKGASEAEGIVVLAQIEVAFLSGLLAPWWALLAVSAASLGLTIYHYRDEFETALDHAPRAIDELMWLRDTQPELFSQILKTAAREALAAIPKGITAEDVAFWLGRILKGAGEIAKGGAAVTLTELVKIIARVSLIVGATHLPHMVGVGLEEAIKKNAADMQAQLKAQGIDVSPGQAQKILRDLYEENDSPARLKELNESLNLLVPALKRLSESLHK